MKISPPSEVHMVRGLNSGTLGTPGCVVVRMRGVRGVGWVDSALVMEVWCVCVCVYVCVCTCVGDVCVRRVCVCVCVHKTQIKSTHKLHAMEYLNSSSD